MSGGVRSCADLSFLRRPYSAELASCPRVSLVKLLPFFPPSADAAVDCLFPLRQTPDRPHPAHKLGSNYVTRYYRALPQESSRRSSVLSQKYDSDSDFPHAVVCNNTFAQTSATSRNIQ